MSWSVAAGSRSISRRRKQLVEGMGEMRQSIGNHPPAFALPGATMSRRSVLAAGLGLAAGAWLAPRARAQAQVKIGYLPVQNCGPLFVAQDQGYMRDAG